MKKKWVAKTAVEDTSTRCLLPSYDVPGQRWVSKWFLLMPMTAVWELYDLWDLHVVDSINSLRLVNKLLAQAQMTWE